MACVRICALAGVHESVHAVNCSVCAIVYIVVVADLSVHMCVWMCVWIRACIRYNVWAFARMGTNCVYLCSGTSRVMPSDIAKKVPGSDMIDWPGSISMVIICTPCIVREHVYGRVDTHCVLAFTSHSLPPLFGAEMVGGSQFTQCEEGREARKPTMNILTCMSSPMILYLSCKRMRMYTVSLWQISPVIVTNWLRCFLKYIHKKHSLTHA